MRCWYGRSEDEEWVKNWGPCCRHRGLGVDSEASPHPCCQHPVMEAGGIWQGVARGWGKHPWDAGEGVHWGKPELCAIYSFFYVISRAAGIRGLIRGTNNDGTCDLSESFGYNYVGRQVKEFLLD